jgi:hypothetical protein
MSLAPMTVAAGKVTQHTLDDLVYKTIVDLLKDRDREVRKAIRRHVTLGGLGQYMSMDSWMQVENRVTIAFLAIRGYPIPLGERR